MRPRGSSASIFTSLPRRCECHRTIKILRFTVISDDAPLFNSGFVTIRCFAIYRSTRCQFARRYSWSSAGILYSSNSASVTTPLECSYRSLTRPTPSANHSNGVPSKARSQFSLGILHISVCEDSFMLKAVREYACRDFYRFITLPKRLRVWTCQCPSSVQVSQHRSEI